MVLVIQLGVAAGVMSCPVERSHNFRTSAELLRSAA